MSQINQTKLVSRLHPEAGSFCRSKNSCFINSNLGSFASPIHIQRVYKSPFDSSFSPSGAPNPKPSSRSSITIPNPRVSISFDSSSCHPKAPITTQVSIKIFNFLHHSNLILLVLLRSSKPHQFSFFKPHHV